MNKYYPNVNAKSPSHARYLQILYALKNGVDVRSVKQRMLDYLITLIDTPEGWPMQEYRDVRPFLDLEDTAYKLGSFVNFAVNNSITLTRTADMLGKSVMRDHESKRTSIRDRNITRVKVGLELLDLLRKEKKITFRREAVDRTSEMMDKDVEEARGRAPYKIKVLDEAFMLKIGMAFYYPDPDVPIFTQPLLAEPVEWEKYYHPVMGELVRNTVEGTRWEFSLNKTPKIFQFMNKIKKTAFKVDLDILDVYLECQEDPFFTQEKKDYSPVQLTSILQQQDEILRIADSLQDNEFWLSSFLDFRGRFYYANTYFHPQGNKVARSLIRFSERKAIGEKGWEGLLLAAASEEGYGKLPRHKKLKHAVDNLEKWMMWAEDPVNYKVDGVRPWTTVKENPCGFLSLILEIKKAMDSGDRFAYKSGIPIFIDASNSGTQILSCLGNDEVGGKLSNLVESDEIGDVYLFIADKVWPNYEYTKEDRKLFTKINKQILGYQKKMDGLYEKKRWDDLKELRKEYSEFYEKNKENIKACSKVFWSDRHEMRRKLCKRPVMTIPYSAGARTIARSLYKDWAPEPEMKGLTGTYCFQLAHDITTAYGKELEIPTDLMRLFIKLGLKAYHSGSIREEKVVQKGKTKGKKYIKTIKKGKGKDLQFTSPESGFVFIQNAREDKYERIDMNRRGLRITLKVCVGQGDVIDHIAVQCASSPNSIHALDAAFLTKVVLNATYPMMIVHDSFATYPGAYDELNRDIREIFVDMFSKDVLMYILAQCRATDLYDTIEKGNLVIDDALNNDFCFDV